MQKGTLDQAISFYKSGNRKAASEVLKNLLKNEPKNEAAWLWLSACVENNEQKLYCLRKVLEINPDNQHATAAILMITSPALPEVDQIVSKPKVSLEQIKDQQPILQTAQRTKKKKKRNKIVDILAIFGLLIIMIACLLSFFDNQESTQKPTEIQTLVVNAGTLSQYEGQFSKDTVVNVYKKNGTLEVEREDDLKQLCLDWLYYRAKIIEYLAKGQTEKANEARASFKRTNAWLDEYHEDDVSSMLSIIEKNNWSNW